MSSLGATDVAQAIAALVSDRAACSEAAATDLLRLLSHELASPSAGATRDSRLGLLLDLLARGVDADLTTEEYDAELVIRTTRDEHWPGSTTLIRAYGHWFKAVAAAARLERLGSAARVPSSNHHVPVDRAYTPDEVRSAIAQFRQRFGAWPTPWELQEWGRLSRERARRRGQPSPRIPSAGPIRRTFGDFPRALRATKEHYRGQLDE